MKQLSQNHILHVVRRFSLNHWGASEQTAWRTATSLKREGISNSIIATSALSQPGPEFLEQISIQRFDYIYPQLLLSQEKSKQLDLKGGNPYSLGLLRAAWSTPCKLFHCHTHSRLASTIRLVAKLRKIPFVVSLHGGAFRIPNSELSYLEQLSSGFSRYGFLLDKVFKPHRVLADASGIICPSYEELTAVRKAFPLKPSTYLPAGVDIEQYAKKSAKGLRAKYSISDDTFVLLCSGRIDSQKNQLLLIEMMHALSHNRSNHFHLILMGHLSNANYFEEIKQQVRKYGLQKSVTLVCDLNSDSEELIAAYQESDALIIPSIHEPSCLPVLEGWAAGLPVVASKISSLTHLVNEKETGLLFNPFSPRSLAEALTELKNNPELREKLIRNGHDTVNKHFTWDHYAQKLMSFYEEVEMFHASQSAANIIC
ncbi:hypothetical protein A3742_12895 [Oleiphilus sp. HI0071]|uniref:glycosyltransferase family 4 protein n=1 Tax=unclassified Oleiphilus TaxID=2631174 RepID=UPI0007C363AB|nr:MULTISPECIES: glycosyltransferase family 4 protein [unclassified Oleiphilus]KZY64009.1 hypothetical protein A3737_14370 [Oleiphilus sp. HI0065]KZY78450.1 hypothetical protein A3742_23145 [Oleiphilus sp. HI0071]KZZ06111.1 hypothetical protein A3744_07490 [Oleiphilus sp. HI0073]KZZ40170.1 hypothetical protein A3758_09875 [Oleiphilus sp. HI0118]KZZ48583.1 hypothetical protein A3760_23155 [Oleiphilus sp. HI0122]KZZ76312.1 hypothetical protein A3767_15195 [Oleiphilus sp. HI0133]